MEQRRCGGRCQAVASAARRPRTSSLRQTDHDTVLSPSNLRCLTAEFEIPADHDDVLQTGVQKSRMVRTLLALSCRTRRPVVPDSSQVSYEPLRSFVCSALQIPELTVGYQHWALACSGYASLLELSAVAELSEGTGPEVEIPQILADVRVRQPHKACYPGTVRASGHATGGAALVHAREAKELRHSARCKLVVLALELGGRWSNEAASFVRLLARSRARAVPAAIRGPSIAAFAFGPPCSPLQPLAPLPPAFFPCPCRDVPLLGDVLADSALEQPLASRVPRATWFVVGPGHGFALAQANTGQKAKPSSSGQRWRRLTGGRKARDGEVIGRWQDWAYGEPEAWARESNKAQNACARERRVVLRCYPHADGSEGDGRRWNGEAGRFVHHMVAKSLAVGWSPLVGHAWVILGYLGWRAAGRREHGTGQAWRVSRMSRPVSDGSSSQNSGSRST
ncbi:hypothetical protein AK812_SmicGene37505 [Symbiodinium microadriaticum]|uniref:Uncharacterized protein n=1 Tax=Symbiodinium microadriaticum TaxID=2951 RepID=A0A1Q9CGB6_SYMMI|nr:hypothetical protein AK812_SmicGene37505 [Symbiodinium microadriaticum]